MKRFYIAFCFSFLATVFGWSQSNVDQLIQNESEIRKEIKELIKKSAVFYDNAEYNKSLAHNIKIIELASQIKDTAALADGYRFLGYDYLILLDTVQAKKSFEKSQKLAGAAQNLTSVGLSYMDLANLYSYSKDNYKMALDLYDKSIEVFETTRDTFNLSTAYTNAIVTLNTHDETPATYPYLIKVDKIKYHLTNSLRAGVQNSWATYYLSKKDYEKVDYYLSELIQDTLLSKSRFELADGYYNFSKSKYAQGKYKEAYNYFALYDSLNTINTQRVIDDENLKVAANFKLSEYKKDLKQNELENQIQADKLSNKSKLNTLLIILTVCLLITISVLYIYFKNRKKYIKRLQKSNEEYFAAKEESERLAKVKSEFFSTVSHELRTPLYGVVGLSTILLDDPTLTTHKEDIKTLKFSADYLLALINDVLQISKIDAKKLEDEKTVFNPREIIKNVTSSFEHMRIQHKNTFSIEVDADVPDFVSGNLVTLSQILMNLIGNATKFTENGTIGVNLKLQKVQDQRATIHFSISDTGLGIPENKQKSIFNEFSQVGTNFNYQGTGLGLPIVKRLLQQSGSDIHLESVYGEGATFSFALTYTIEQNVQEPKLKNSHNTAELLQNKNILIVDDNRINQIVTQKILEKNEVICSVANNGEEAVEKAKSNTYDLILMDINMPVMDGVEATKMIRTFDSQIPIIALTAVEMEEMRERIYDCGMNDIIIKPYDVQRFIRTIGKNLVPKEVTV